MSYTKRQFVSLAFDEIGLAEYNFDLQPEQLQSAVRKLDAMIASWNGKGIRLRYPLTSSPENTSLNTETEVPDYANEAIYLNLAIRIAPSFGKVVSNETKADAKAAYQVVLQRTQAPAEMQLTNLPRGAGNKPWRYTGNEFLAPPTDELESGPEGDFNF